MDPAKYRQQLEDAHRTYSEYTREVHNVAAGAHQDILHRLESAMTSLGHVVTEVHATYTEDGVSDPHRLQILNDLKTSFDNVETAARNKLTELQSVHEKVQLLQNNIIYPLKQEMESLVNLSNKQVAEAKSTIRDLQDKIEKNDEEMAAGQQVVDEWDEKINHPVIEAAATVAQGFYWLGSQVTKVFNDTSEDDGPLDQLHNAQEQLNNIRVCNETLRRERTEAQQEAIRLTNQAETASWIMQQVAPLVSQTQNLASMSEHFKAALINIKDKATNLTREAAAVAGSAEVTNKLSYTKEDFAFGLLNICGTALFDGVVIDEIATVLDDLERNWTVNGKLTMRKRLNDKLQAVRKAVSEFKPTNDEAELDKAVEDADAADDHQDASVANGVGNGQNAEESGTSANGESGQSDENGENDENDVNNDY